MAEGGKGKRDFTLRAEFLNISSSDGKLSPKALLSPFISITKPVYYNSSS